jgi:hypothetical protein
MKKDGRVEHAERLARKGRPALRGFGFCKRWEILRLHPLEPLHSACSGPIGELIGKERLGRRLDPLQG